MSHSLCVKYIVQFGSISVQISLVLNKLPRVLNDSRVMTAFDVFFISLYLYIPMKIIQVIMGGGRQQLVSNATGTDEDPISTSPWTCYRQDGRNLIEQYKTDKETRGLKHSVVMNNQELRELNVNETDYLLGKLTHFPSM